MKKKIFTVIRSANLDSVSEIRLLLNRVLSKLNLSEDLVKRKLLCFSELATNAVKHGKSEYLMISLDHDLISWNLKLSYDGEEFDPFHQNSLNNLESIFSMEEESGRGCYLVDTLSDMCSYSYAENTNEINLKWVKQDEERRSLPKLLVVDDDPVSLKLVQLFCGNKYEVTLETNVLDALAKIELEHFDIILSDINMPEKSGFDFREEMLLSEKITTVPFIFFTSDNDGLTIDKAIKYEVDGIIKKPLSKNNVLRNLDLVLTRSKGLLKSYSKKIDDKILNKKIINAPEESFGWRFAHSVRNTGIGGGDLVTFFTVGKNSTLILADIMGHNETSKFFALSYLGYIKGFLASSKSLNAGNILTNLNRAAYEDELLDQTTLTAIACQFSGDGGLVISNAGHVKPVLISPENYQQISKNEILPGLDKFKKYQETNYQITSEQRVVFFTDGFFEAFTTPAKRKAFEEKMNKMLHETIKYPIDVSIKLVMDEFDRAVGNKSPDDVFILMAERK